MNEQNISGSQNYHKSLKKAEKFSFLNAKEANPDPPHATNLTPPKFSPPPPGTPVLLSFTCYLIPVSRIFYHSTVKGTK